MKLFSPNWRLKLAALFIASSTWGVVAYASNPVSNRDVQRVPVQVVAVANPNWVVINPLPAVAVSVSGLDHNVNGDANSKTPPFDPRSLHAGVDLSHAHLGENLVHVHVENTDSRVTVTQVVPDTVQVTLDEKDVVNKQIELPITIRNTPNGCCTAQNSNAVAKPDTVQLTGPKSLLARAVPYVEVDVTAATNDVVLPVDVKLHNVDPRVLSLVTIVPRQVTVTVPVTQVKKRVPAGVHPVRVGAVASGYQITDIKTAPDTVTVEGDPGLVANITSIDTAPVNLTGATSDVVQTVSFRPPAGVVVTDATQVTVHYFISRIPDVQPTPSPSPVPSPSPSR
jgi:YbbR domain-containing protein